MSDPITNEEIEAKRTPAGGWKKATLAEWGVPWPAPKGWRKTIVAHGTPYDPALNTFAAPAQPEYARVTAELLRRHEDEAGPDLIDGEPFGVEGPLDIDPATLLRKVVVAVINAGHASDLYDYPEVLAYFGSRILPQEGRAE
jgi:hypothetical protein